MRAASQMCAQVIVVDSGSADRTIEIARANGAEVIHQEWLGNGHQKRVGEDYARHDWLLDLDADEVLSPELIEQIRCEFSGDGPTNDVYQLALTIVDPIGRVWHRSGVAFRAKLYNRNIVRMPAERAWDQLTLSPNIRVQKLHAPLLHYAFTSIGHLMRKQESAMRNRVTGMPIRSKLSVQLRIAFGFPGYFFEVFFRSRSMASRSVRPLLFVRLCV